jgi:hypothetical protein
VTSFSIAKGTSAQPLSVSKRFLSIGERSVGVLFSALTYKVGNNGERVIVSSANRTLHRRRASNRPEKTTFDKMKDKASNLSHKAADKAVDLRDQAAKKIGDMKKGEPKKE